MHHKKIERLLLFVEVAKQLSFTKAADSLAISRGYLSAQIKILEKEMGYPLLIRSTRTVRLTSQGEQVLNGMEGVKQNLLQIERDVAYEHSAIEGSIRITAPLQLTQEVLSELCAEFSQRYPKVHFEIECSYTSINLVKDNFDFAFRATQTPPENLVAKKLGHYRRVLVGAPNYLEKHPPIEKPQQLNQHQCLTGQGVTNWDFASGSVEVGGWLSINENHILKQQVLAGRGLMQAPSYYVKSELASGQLRQVLSHESIWVNDIYLLYPPMVQRSTKLSAFITFAAEFFARSDA